MVHLAKFGWPSINKLAKRWQSSELKKGKTLDFAAVIDRGVTTAKRHQVPEQVFHGCCKGSSRTTLSVSQSCTSFLPQVC
jgi:hypothetical protein